MSDMIASGHLLLGAHEDFRVAEPLTHHGRRDALLWTRVCPVLGDTLLHAPVTLRWWPCRSDGAARH